MSDTVIFAIGTFGSKLLTYFMLPIVTGELSANEYNTADLIAQTANLLFPLVCLSITSAVLRYGLDKAYTKTTVFTVSLVVIGFGFGGMLLLWPLLSCGMVLLKLPAQYTGLIYLYVLASVLHSLFGCFIRTLNRLKLFAYDGIQNTALSIVFTLVNLFVFHWGAVGYTLAVIAADAVSAIFLFFAAKLHRFVKIDAYSKSIAKSMLRYSIPLIPTTLFWWITNVSDRYMVTYMVGSEVAGLYAASSKIPNLINLLSTIFSEAWQLSAISEKDSPTRNRFFSKVFNAYTSLLFCAASFLTMTCQIFTRVLVAGTYYEAWTYIPVLLLAMVFNCFCSFLNSIYMVERKSVISLVTVMAGAITNVVLNLILIRAFGAVNPVMGAFGAALATLASYVVVFVLRLVTTKQMISIHINRARMGLNILLVAAQVALTNLQVPHWMAWNAVLFALLLLLNAYSIFSIFRTFLAAHKAPKKAD